MDDLPRRPRIKNPRGHGRRLRREILQAARRVLDREDHEEALTLRAVAREAGITAPSIYAHFGDREAIVEALVDEGFEQLTQRLEDSHVGHLAPTARLMAGSIAYLDFASTQPQRYRLMFMRTATGEMRPGHPSATAFEVLVTVVAQCVQEGQSTSVDPFADATAVWAGLHGLALLRRQQPDFPWPDEAVLLRHLVHSLARVRE